MTRTARPRVVHVIAALAEGGAERQLELLVREQGPDVSVIALYDGGPIAETLRRDGYDVRVLGMDGTRKALAWPRLARVLREVAPEVVHVHLLAAQLWGIPAARLAGVPVVISSEHSLNEAMIEGRDHSPWLVRVYRLLAGMASHTIAVSEATRANLEGWGVPAHKISVIDNGLNFSAMSYDPAGRERIRAELGIGPEVALVGAVGRLFGSKRFDALIAALAPTLNSSRRLMIVGEGELRESLTAAARDLGVADLVRFTGARGDMRELYSAMDVLVSPSRDETFGIAVVEARACGMPVIFATCPAITALREPVEGSYKLPQGDPVEEAQAIRAQVDRALADLTSRSGARLSSPEPLVERYAMSGTASAIDRLYRRLLYQAGSPRRARGSGKNDQETPR
ncbi:MAG: glycosyltransferase [Austwickia sp.]|nr:glycosyltransferase [Austwickia sp.]